MIERRDRGPVSLLRMHHGKANALDSELVDELSARLDELRDGQRVVVLTGVDGMFSAGVDLRRVLQQGGEYSASMILGFEQLLARLVEFPRPVIAAINGHAIAGGFVLSCACDLRLLADGPAKLGLTELQVGVPFPPTALEVVRSAIGLARTRELVYRGRLYTAVEAAAKGLVDELVPAAELRERSLSVARQLAKIPPPTFEISKLQLAQPLRTRLEHLAEGHLEAVQREWAAERTLLSIQRFVERHLR